MMSNEEMVRNVFRRTDEYFQKKEKRNNAIKKGASFMSLFSIITLAGLGLWSSAAQNEAVPSIPEQISVIKTVSVTEETASEFAVTTTDVTEIQTDESPFAITTSSIAAQIYKAEVSKAPVTETVTTVVSLAKESVIETTAVATDDTITSTDIAVQTTDTVNSENEMSSVTTLVTEYGDTKPWTDEADGTYGDLSYIVCHEPSDYIEIVSCAKDAVSVEIPEEIEGLPVKFVHSSAFQDCTALRSVTLPESLENIGHTSFWGCCSLEYIYIPKNVTYIGAHSFLGCVSLKNIDVDPENEYYKSENGVLFAYETGSKENQYLICYPTNHEGAEYMVPDTVKGIDSYAFYANSSLTSVVLQEGLEHIRSSAFKHCTKLASIDIPDSVVDIDGSAFYGCTKLASVKMPGGEKKDDSLCYWICGDTFGNCTSLKSVTIPEKFEVVFDSAFDGCMSLESIVIENPECEIWCDDEAVTMIPENTVIYGYSNSKAQEYAETYGRKFAALDEMSAAETGDIDSNGTVDISDATAVLSMYAESAAGISSAIYTSAASDPADINGDGSIDISDATAILIYYTQNAAGLVPDWDAVIN